LGILFSGANVERGVSEKKNVIQKGSLAGRKRTRKKSRGSWRHYPGSREKR